MSKFNTEKKTSTENTADEHFFTAKKNRTTESKRLNFLSFFFVTGISNSHRTLCAIEMLHFWCVVSFYLSICIDFLFCSKFKHVLIC